MADLKPAMSVSLVDRLTAPTKKVAAVGTGADAGDAERRLGYVYVCHQDAQQKKRQQQQEEYPFNDPVKKSAHGGSLAWPT